MGWRKINRRPKAALRFPSDSRDFQWRRSMGEIANDLMLKRLAILSSGFCEGLNLQIFKVMGNGKINPIKFEFNCEWGPEKINFQGDNELLIRKTIDCPVHRYGKLTLN